MAQATKEEAVKKDSENILSVLKSRGKINSKQAEKIKKEAEKKGLSYFNLIKEKDLVDEKDLIKSCSVLFGLSQVELSHLNIKEEVLKWVPENLARKFKIVPFKKKGNRLKLAVANPYQLPDIENKVISKIKEKDGGIKVWFYLAKENDIKNALSAYNQKKSKEDKKKMEVQDEKKSQDQKNAGKKMDKILEILISQNKIDRNKAEKITEKAQEKKEDIVETLRSSKTIKDADIQRARAQKHKLPFIKLTQDKIKKEAVDRIPYDIAKKYQIVSFDSIGERVLKSAVIDPEPKPLREIIDFAKTKKGIDIKLFITDKDSFEKVLSVYKKKGEEKKEKRKKGEEKKKEGKGRKKIKKKEKEEKKVEFPQPPKPVEKIEVDASLKEKGKERKKEKKERKKKEEEKKKEKKKEEEGRDKGKKKEKEEEKEEKKPKAKKVDEDLSLQDKSEQGKRAVEAEEKEGFTGADVELKGRIGELLKKKVENKEQLEKIIKKGSVPRLVAGIIHFALKKRASDVHIQPEEGKTVLRYRIDGVLNKVTEIPKDLHSAVISRVKILSKLRIDEKRIPQDGRFEVSFKDRSVDLRVSTLPTTLGEKVVLRLLDKSRKMFKLSDLGLKGSGYKRFKENIHKPYGFILATGPTGSGKTTTLYTALSKINKPDINIVTLEDPIEYEIEGITQSQARPDVGFSFANGLRSVLRQDPDIIMVGEIRDQETAEMAIHAALTGHLVYSTLHTTDTAGAVPRMIDMGVEPFLISSAANMIMAQRLVRKICPHCKKEDETFDKKAKKRVKKMLSGLPKKEKKAIPKESDWKFYKGGGCDKCNQGYKGRVGIFEIMPVTEEIKHLITDDVSSADIAKKAKDQGMVTMVQDGLIKALRGVTSLEEVFRVTVAKEEQF